MRLLTLPGTEGHDTTHPGVHHNARPWCRKGNISRTRDLRPPGGTYGGRVALPLEIRRDRWATFVRRALANAKQQKGWSVATVLKETGIGKTTLYRWLKGDWDTDPEPSKIESFCDGLGMPTDRAFTQLWPGKAGKAKAPEPTPLPDEVEQLMRRLRDPSTSEAERVIMLGLVTQAAHVKLGAPDTTRRRRA